MRPTAATAWPWGLAAFLLGPCALAGQVSAEDSSATVELERRHERHPRNREVRVALAERYLRQGRGREAAGLIDGYLTTRFASPTLYGMVGAGLAIEGDVDGALETVTTGLAAYPYSIPLYHARLQLRGIRDGLRHPDEFLGLPDSVAPEGVRLEAAANVALDSALLVEGLLYAEHAYYLLGDDFDPTLSTRIERVYDGMLDRAASDRPWNVAAYPDTSWRRAYLQALTDAAERVAEARERFGDDFEAYGAMRAAGLRLFAERGHLRRTPEPLLVDLYVLDRAGHLGASTARMLALGHPSGHLHLLYTFETGAREAEEYIANQWAADVDAYLGAVGTQ